MGTVRRRLPKKISRPRGRPVSKGCPASYRKYLNEVLKMSAAIDLDPNLSLMRRKAAMAKAQSFAKDLREFIELSQDDELSGQQSA
jgi:hypothetical protein